MTRPRLLITVLPALLLLALFGGPSGPRAPGRLPARGARQAVALPRFDLASSVRPVAEASRGVAPDATPAPPRPAAEQHPSPVPVRAAPVAPLGRVIALTFDDGPDPTWTPQVLALLAQFHAHATFCMIGREAKAQAALVRAVVAGGHALCNHTFTHDEQLAERSDPVIRHELTRTTQVLRSASVGAPVAFFRAPGGAWTAGLRAAARRAGLLPLGWTVDPRDWDDPGTAQIVRAVLAGARPGAVILLHDGGGDRSQTVAALRLLLPDLVRRGFTVVAATPALAARTR